jgi:hypothetical protein
VKDHATLSKLVDGHDGSLPLTCHNEGDADYADGLPHPFDDPNIDFAAASTYNIYHRKDEKCHYIVTPITSKYREKSSLRKALKDQDIFRHPEKLPKAAAGNTFFVHEPYVSFHHAPRTLRRGPEKDGPVVCLINNSWFWRKWRLQFGEQLKHAIDPRGVVPKEYAAAAARDGKVSRLKGYRVRTWRLWGETGKEHHRKVNEVRKSGVLIGPSSEKPLRQPIIDEEVQFSWHSPFTHKPRHYRFDYAGLEFYWKGTGTVKESKTCGWFMRFHHVKLCVRLPISAIADESDGPVKRTLSSGSMLSPFRSRSNGFREVCLARYTSSIITNKAGVLQVYDDVVYRLLMEGVIVMDTAKKRDLEASGVVGVKALRLYEIIIASALCMIIGEWQKRQVLIAILAAGGEGGSGGG